MIFLAVLLIYQVSTQWPDGNLHVVFCSVGQGDAILVSRGFWQMLIDAGPDDSVSSCLREHMPFWDRRIELMLATHLDEDHIGGFTEVIKDYQFESFYLSHVEDSETFKNVVSALKAYHQSRFQIKAAYAAEEINIQPGIRVYFLSPEQGKSSLSKVDQKELTEIILSDEKLANLISSLPNGQDANALSTVLFLNYGGFDLLLMGDVSTDIELALIDKGLIKKIETLKVGHHGANTSTSARLIRVSQPEISVLSCGLNNQYGHPDPTVLSLLRTSGSRVERTDQLGTIELITNGKYYWLK